MQALPDSGRACAFMGTDVDVRANRAGKSTDGTSAPAGYQPKHNLNLSLNQTSVPHPLSEINGFQSADHQVARKGRVQAQFQPAAEMVFHPVHSLYIDQ